MMRRHTDPDEYDPRSDRGALAFGLTRRQLVRRVAPTLIVGFLVWILARSKAGYDGSIADPPLAQSRFIAESLRLEKRRDGFFAQQRVDSLISAERYQRINERFDLLDHKLDCLAHPHSSGC